MGPVLVLRRVCSRGTQLIRRTGAVLVAFSLAATLVVAVREPARAAALCGTPGRDGSGTITGVVNTYFPATASAAATATSITLGAHATGDANVAIATGDLLLVIQMQGATINSSNSSAYGDGSTGAGYTSATAGTYEYVVANGNLATTGGTLAIKGTNSGGLNHAYTASGSSRFQVIRVPQYNAPTIGAALTALSWNGTAGGVLAIDAANLVAASGTVSVDGRGFRGGGARQLAGDATAANGDYMNSNAKNAHGQKGEGIAGTPTYVYSSVSSAESGSGTADGYPGGDTGRGAPGNAGGGGADADVPANDQNTGGGGGGNGGAGGVGGKSYSSDLAYGGLGGTFTPAQTQLVMGGGGGAGSRNNSSGAMSSGGSGGGIVMMRVAAFTGTMTVSANGMMGVDPDNDGGGGGGAGGSVIVTAPATIQGITVNANGANGTDADVLNAGKNAHGPGGGGGGGVEVDSGGIYTHNVNGGAAGVTDGSPTPDAHYGAAAGATGQLFGMNYLNVPGASSGAECVSSTGTLYIGPVGVPQATGSYDGNAATTNNNDFVEKSFTPAGFNAINSSTTPGSPNGNTYTAAVTGIALRHEVKNTAGGNVQVIYYAQAPSGWTVAVYNDSGGALGTQIAGTASSNTYQTTATVAIAGGASAFVWTVYAAPTGLQAFNRFDAILAAIDGGNVANNNQVHDELYTGYVVQTKSYTITSTGCSGSVPAGTWCPGGILSYTIDVRNIAVAANGTTPASATLTANTLTLTDDGSNTNSWAKDGGYMNTPGYSSSGTAPTTVTYYYNASSSTAFPASYNTTNKVFKITASWTALGAGSSSQLMFSAVQF
ncbi:MAG TPA: hypothetical protein VHS78_14435 [Candidatus Elarobacter sp.]|nr:hypothetical protein [Candidatus Elarobacter sp.]